MVVEFAPAAPHHRQAARLHHSSAAANLPPPGRTLPRQNDEAVSLAHARQFAGGRCFASSTETGCVLQALAVITLAARTAAGGTAGCLYPAVHFHLAVHAHVLYYFGKKMYFPRKKM